MIRTLETLVGIIALALLAIAVSCAHSHTFTVALETPVPACRPSSAPSTLCNRISRTKIPRECALCPFDDAHVENGCLSSTGILCVENCNDDKCVKR